MAAMWHTTLLKRFNEHHEDVVSYFDPCADLLTNNYRYQVVISYMFSRIEIAHREALYFGVVKLHNVDRKLASTAIDKYDLTRKDFRAKLEQIYGYHIPNELREKIESAENARDRILHGKKIKKSEMAHAILDTMVYFNGLNDLLYEKSEIWLAGDRTGFKGRGASHSAATSNWILRGMGLL